MQLISLKDITLRVTEDRQSNAENFLLEAVFERKKKRKIKIKRQYSYQSGCNGEYFMR